VTAGEVLVVDYALQESASPWPVIGTLPPRVAVLRAAADDVPAIARMSRVVIVRRSDAPDEVVGDPRALQELDDAARLFVEAWRSQAPAKTDRPGDSLPWDAPGFEPPDAPRGADGG
jgi:hypothetical protein